MGLGISGTHGTFTAITRTPVRLKLGGEWKNSHSGIQQHMLQTPWGSGCPDVSVHGEAGGGLTQPSSQHTGRRSMYESTGGASAELGHILFPAREPPQLSSGGQMGRLVTDMLPGNNSTTQLSL